MSTSIADLRKEYARHGLDETDIYPDPILQFRHWFEAAAEVEEPNAMILATADAQGRVSARIVLLKEFNERGFVFFTNYASRKGRHLIENPWAALTFWWKPLERQVRIEGRVEQVGAELSDAYFAGRPRGSQLGAWASEQSEVIESREVLDQRLVKYTEQFEGRAIPRPLHWGGFRVVPDLIEFWQGRPSRLHDRIRYTLDEASAWHIERLAP